MIISRPVYRPLAMYVGPSAQAQALVPELEVIATKDDAENEELEIEAKEAKKSRGKRK